MNNNISYEMTEQERQQNSIRTIINMLIARRWITNEPEKHYNILVKISTEIIDTTSIETDVKKIAIKFYNSKLNTLKNDKEIDIFISNFPDFHKILIVNDLSTKVDKQIMDSKGFEIFRIMDIIRDISKHHLVPKHILLSKEEATLIMEEYKLKPKDMGRIYSDDPMAKYLYAQKDDIIQKSRFF